MDVIIKSFNRPYYLERCICSIHQYLKGKYNIVILDDGTPQVYLDKIAKLFPDVKIFKSEVYQKKSKALSEHLAGKKYHQQSIPAEFWKSYIANTSEIFLLLEEDAWLTGPVDLDQMLPLMRHNNILTLKLFWASNAGIIKGKKIQLDHEVEEIIPELPVMNHFISSFLLTNRWRVRSILRKAGLISDQFMLPYYTLYTVASAFFRKDYWLQLWNDTKPQINEGFQLSRALQWRTEKKDSRYAKTVMQKINTSYITSSYNSFKTIDFDFIRFNHMMNEAWLNGNLNAMQNFPSDYSVPYLEHFLKEIGNDDCSPIQWKKWITVFKNQYKKLGCVVDP